MSSGADADDCPSSGRDRPGGRSSGDDFAPTASWETLKTRARLLKQVRAFFDCRGFLEVETPSLSAEAVVDRHLDPIPVQLFADPRQPAGGRQMWLQTSPEFAMKRLVAAGAERIYQITRAFRGGERGQFHLPEFTIVEWYRVGDSFQEGMRLLADLAEEMLASDGHERLSYAAAFQRYVGIDPHSASVADLRRAGRELNLDLPENRSPTAKDELLDLLLATRVEPHLGSERPLVLFDYPASQPGLARVRPGQPPVAERFELYHRGVELANGYHELLDHRELRRRNQAVNELRREDGKYPVPEESRLLAAMENGLPPCCGAALGFDRLAMLSVGASRIDDVVAFPIERA